LSPTNGQLNYFWKQTKRGLLVVFEGIDKSGKTTQSLKLVESLNNSNIPAVHKRFPDRTTSIGKLIDSYLKSSSNLSDQAIHLLFSADRWEARDTLTKHIEEGKIVVVDRYAYSGAAFSSAKGIDLEWCKAPDRGLPKPDLVIYLDISIDDACKRGDFGTERYEKKEFQESVKRKFDLLREKDWIILDARRQEKDITEEVKNLGTHYLIFFTL